MTLTWNRDYQACPPQELWQQDGAFTTLYIQPQHAQPLLFWHEHWQRLCYTMHCLKKDQPFSQSFVQKQCLHAIRQTQQQQLLRIMLTPQHCTIALRPSSNQQTHLTGKLYTLERSQAELKHLHYQNVLDILQQIDRSAEEALLCNQEHHILEGATSNLIFIKGQEATLPAGPQLPGITQQKILPYLQQHYDIRKLPLRVEDLHQYDEIIACGSGKGIRTISRIPKAHWQAKSHHHGHQAKTWFQEHYQAYP